MVKFKKEISYTIRISDKDYELSEEDARELYNDLHSVFGSENNEEPKETFDEQMELVKRVLRDGKHQRGHIKDRWTLPDDSYYPPFEGTPIPIWYGPQSHSVLGLKPTHSTIEESENYPDIFKEGK